MDSRNFCKSILAYYFEAQLRAEVKAAWRRSRVFVYKVKIYETVGGGGGGGSLSFDKAVVYTICIYVEGERERERESRTASSCEFAIEREGETVGNA
jgi:hypothetical protein